MSANPLDVFRKRMKETRTQKGITLKEIAEAIGVKEATVQRYESGNGIKTVPYETVVGIAETLGVSPSYLLGWEKPSIRDAELLADIAGDSKLMKCVRQIASMGNADREKVYSYVDYIKSTK